MYLPKIFSVLSSFDSTGLSGLFAQLATPKLSKLKSVGLSDLKGAKTPAFDKAGQPENFVYLNENTGRAALDKRGDVYATRYGSWPTQQNIFENIGISGNISQEGWKSVFVEYRGKNKFRVVMDDPNVKGPALYAMTQYAFISGNPTSYVNKLVLLDKTTYKKALNNRNTPVHLKSDGFRDDKYSMPSLSNINGASYDNRTNKVLSLQQQPAVYFAIRSTEPAESSIRKPDPIKTIPLQKTPQKEILLSQPFSFYLTEPVEETGLELTDIGFSERSREKQAILDEDTGLTHLPGGHLGYNIDQVQEFHNSAVQAGETQSSGHVQPRQFAQDAPLLVAIDTNNRLRILHASGDLGSFLYAIPKTRPGEIRLKNSSLVTENYDFVDGRTYNHILRTDPGRIPGAPKAQKAAPTP